MFTVQDIPAHVVADPVDIPVRGAQQPLHPVRGHRAGMLGQRPAVLALQPGQQSPQVGAHPSAWLRAHEPRPDQPDHHVQPRHPPGKIHHAVIITARRASASHDTPQVPLHALEVGPRGASLLQGGHDLADLPLQSASASARRSSAVARKPWDRDAG